MGLFHFNFIDVITHSFDLIVLPSKSESKTFFFFVSTINIFFKYLGLAFRPNAASLSSRRIETPFKLLSDKNLKSYSSLEEISLKIKCGHF